MVFTEDDLQERLLALRKQSKKSFQAFETEFEEHYNWILTVTDGVRNGSINVKCVLLPKTPGKLKVPLGAIRESLESTLELDDAQSTSNSSQNKRTSKKGKTKKAAGKTKKEPIIEEDHEELEISCLTKPQKRLSEENVDCVSKRLCGTRSSGTTSRDSGLSSVGSRVTQGSAIGVNVKEEVLTPKNTTCESNTSTEDQNDATYSVSTAGNTTTTISTVISTTICTETSSPPKKRSRSAARGTFIIKEELGRSSRSISEPRTPIEERNSEGNNKTLTIPSAANTLTPIRSTPDAPSQLQKQANTFKSPILKAPPAHLLKGESVKKAVKAFEALNEDLDTEGISTGMPPPAIPPPAVPPPPKPLVDASSAVSSLDDALNAPTRVTRTKTRAMAKAAAAVAKADEETKTQKAHHTSVVSNILKSPVHKQYQLQKSIPAPKAIEKKVEYHEKENFTFTASKIVMKPFTGSASKQPALFLKTSTPMNRFTPLTPSHASSTSFTAPRINNLVTCVESFISKPVVNHEVKPSREENAQKLAAKVDVAGKKREEILKTQMEEKVKKREEKRLKVCATREAMVKEKVEMQMKLEREREEKQRQVQAERDEKLRQEYLKKKRLAQQKAAETEERRRQEEAARLAKLKHQEEEQRRIAAQRRREQEEAERKQKEREQQEREAAAYRAKEAERLLKEAALKVKKTSKVQLDQTYDKVSPATQSYGMTPGPEERQPGLIPNPENYGIDDANTDDSSEDEAKPKKVVPLWAQSKHRVPKLKDDYEITHPQMFMFFGSKKSTPDLAKIFTAIDRRQLVRKSSAVWRTPPVKH